jgi:hypothetical protein
MALDFENVGLIPTSAVLCIHRLMAQDSGFSIRKPQFKSEWRHCALVAQLEE